MATMPRLIHSLSLIFVNILSCGAMNEKEALLDWKMSLSTFNADGKLQSWTQETEPCATWEGVFCSNSEVYQLELAGQGLQGTLPAQLSSLTSLEMLSMKFNQLQGTALPGSWAVLTRLRMIDLADNSLTGHMTMALGAFSSVNTLALQNNLISGSLPEHLGSLQYLSLGSNSIGGTLPLLWGTVTSLTSLKLGQNQLTGELPPQWSALASLHFLELQDNQLTGTLPSGWSGMTSLTFMQLFNNYLDSGQLQQQEEQGLSGANDWVLLPQQTAAAGGPDDPSGMDNLSRLFSPAAPGTSPTVVQESGQLPQTIVLVIVLSVTVAVTAAIIAVLVLCTVRAIRAYLSEVKPLTMTDLATAKETREDETGGKDGSRAALRIGIPDRISGVTKRGSPVSYAPLHPRETEMSNVRTSKGKMVPAGSCELPVLPQPEVPQGSRSPAEADAKTLIFGGSQWKHID